MGIHVGLGLKSTGFFLVLSLTISYLMLPGFLIISDPALIAILKIVCGAAICFAATGIFLARAPAAFFPDVGAGSFKDTYRTLPKLILILGIFAGVFAVISGLVSVLVFYVFSVGIPEPDRRFPVMICIYIVILASIPFFIRAFTGFAAGDRCFKSLLKSSVRMGGPLYLKILIIGLIAVFLSFLIRLLPITAPEPAGDIITLALTSVVLGAATAASWIIFRKDTERRAEE